MLLKTVETPEVKEIRTARNGNASGCPRDSLGNRFVYVVVSARARGLSIGLNLNPDKRCNFDCVYCEVNREGPAAEHELDLGVMAEELERTLLLIQSGKIRQITGFQGLDADMMQLRHVAFSGDGEPTLRENFAEIVQEVVHVRARGLHPFFKMVLITNGTWLDASAVHDGLRYFTWDDEVRVKLDAGTQAYMHQVNRTDFPLEKLMDNIRMIGQKRPIIIQSLFPLLAGQEPTADEIDQYLQRLRELRDGGAMISLVQIYSATRPAAHSDCRHIPLQSLARISRRIKAEVGLKAEVF